MFMLDEGGGGAIEHTTPNQVEIVCVIKCNEFSEVTLANHLSHLFMTAWILFYLCQTRGGGNRRYYTKSGTNYLVIKCNEFSQVTLATQLAHPFKAAWILFYLC